MSKNYLDYEEAMEILALSPYYDERYKDCIVKNAPREEFSYGNWHALYKAEIEDESCPYMSLEELEDCTMGRRIAQDFPDMFKSYGIQKYSYFFRYLMHCDPYQSRCGFIEDVIQDGKDVYFLYCTDPC